MKIYLSGPLTEEADPVFAEAGERFVAAGQEVVVPVASRVDDAIIPDHRENLRSLIDCGAVAMLPGWKDDPRSFLEYKVGRALGLLVSESQQFFGEDGAVKGKIHACSVCGTFFKRGGGVTPALLLCDVHDYMRPARVPGTRTGRTREPVVILPPDREGTGYEERVVRFWGFARERHSIYLKRLAGQAPPWTDDVLMQTRQFTNVYRELDPGTVAFRRWRSQHEGTVEDVAFWSLAYRMTNHADILDRRSLPDRDPKSVSEWIRALIEDDKAGLRVQPSTHRARGFQQLRAALVGACFDLEIADVETAQEAWGVVKSFFGLGEFYATQVMGDVMYDPLSPWDVDSYVPLAIGSTRALYWMSKGELIKGAVPKGIVPTDLEFLYRELHDEQEGIDGPELTYVDVEHTLCEMGKYVMQEDPLNPFGLRIFSTTKPNL